MQDADLGITVAAKGFSFRDGIWYKKATIRNSQLEAPVRFLLKASDVPVDDPCIYVMFDINGDILYQLKLEVQLVKTLERIGKFRYEPVQLDLDLLAGQAGAIQESLGLMKNVCKYAT